MHRPEQPRPHSAKTQSNTTNNKPTTNPSTSLLHHSTTPTKPQHPRSIPRQTETSVLFPKRPQHQPKNHHSQIIKHCPTTYLFDTGVLVDTHAVHKAGFQLEISQGCWQTRSVYKTQSLFPGDLQSSDWWPHACSEKTVTRRTHIASRRIRLFIYLTLPLNRSSSPPTIPPPTDTGLTTHLPMTKTQDITNETVTRSLQYI